MDTRLREEILSHIEDIGKDEKLFPEKNFMVRSQAIDEIECHIIEQLHAFGESTDSSERIDEFMQRAERIKRQLEAVDTILFERLRKEISQGKYREDSLINLIDEYLDHNLNEFLQPGLAGYDHLDIFLNGLLTYRSLPPETKEREPEMVYYQKTPARIIFELVKKSAFQQTDVFYDLGSGPGQVTLLVNLISSVVSKGVEFEPAYCNYAKARVSELNLNHVHFINSDARFVDYTDGTVFFMYTPFEGEILRDVLGNLFKESGKRKIRIFSYGSCTPVVARQDWLRQIGQIENDTVELAEFVSR